MDEILPEMLTYLKELFRMVGSLSFIIKVIQLIQMQYAMVKK